MFLGPVVKIRFSFFVFRKNYVKDSMKMSNRFQLHPLPVKERLSIKVFFTEKSKLTKSYIQGDSKVWNTFKINNWKTNKIKIKRFAPHG